MAGCWALWWGYRPPWVRGGQSRTGRCHDVAAAEPSALPVSRPSDLSEQAVARVAEPGHDVAPVIQPLVDRGGHDPDPLVGIFRGEGLLDVPQAFGRGEQAD